MSDTERVIELPMVASGVGCRDNRSCPRLHVLATSIIGNADKAVGNVIQRAKQCA
jgi:hypothetical protein